MERTVRTEIETFTFHHGKMAFVSGPRQVGKTTLARLLMKRRASSAYFNWDQVEFKRLFAHSPEKLLPPPGPKGERPLLVLDEIHKLRGWKSRIKGLFDTLPYPCDILVTGSARLDVFKKGGDSLHGRYHSIRLHPYSVREVAGLAPNTPEGFLASQKMQGDYREVRPSVERTIHRMMRFGGFPEPYGKSDTRFLNVWRKSRSERIIREDLRDLTQLPELGKLELLSDLLPERIGSPISLQSLSVDLETSYPTVARWIQVLHQLYYTFPVPSYHRNLGRALKKSGKLYFWDWTLVPQDGLRLENLVALHLLKACHYWTDFGHGDFKLWTVRDKEQREVDFLVTESGRPWLLMELKTGEKKVSSSLRYFDARLKPALSMQAVLHPKDNASVPLGWVLYNLV